MGPITDLEAWVKPQMEMWAEGIQSLAKFSARHLQMTYSVMGITLKIKCQYLQSNVLEVGSLIHAINWDLREVLFPALFGVEEVHNSMR